MLIEFQRITKKIMERKSLKSNIFRLFIVFLHFADPDLIWTYHVLLKIWTSECDVITMLLQLLYGGL